MLIEVWLKLFLAWLSFSCLPQSTATRIWFRENAVDIKQEMSPPNSDKEAVVRDIVKMLQIAFSHDIANLTCLHRVLVLKNVLKKKGITASIIIGVRKDKSKLAAHAWLQIGNDVIDDQKSYTDQFKPLNDQNSANLIFLNTQKKN